MKTLRLLNYERDRWTAGDSAIEIPSAIDGSPVATTGSGGLDFGQMLRHAREVGSPALRKLTFHERARMIKALGLAIMARKEELYELNYLTGATRKDGWIDIEGGAGTLFSFSSKGRRELPDAHEGSWLAYLAIDTLQNHEKNKGVDPKYRPRGYNEGPKD